MAASLSVAEIHPYARVFLLLAAALRPPRPCAPAPHPPHPSPRCLNTLPSARLSRRSHTPRLPPLRRRSCASEGPEDSDPSGGVSLTPLRIWYHVQMEMGSQ